MSTALVRLAVVTGGLTSLPLYTLDLHRRFGSGSNVLAWYVGLHLVLGAIFLLVAWVVLRRPTRDPLALALLLTFGVAFRVAVLPAPVVLSSDLYRYLWDGRVQRAGINPYRYAPAAPELVHLRDDRIHAEINRPSARTIYPPGAEAIFLAITTVAPDSILGWRLFLLLCEGLNGVLLLRLLGRMAVPREAIVLYAWAPLVVFEGTQAGHLEVAFLPAVLLALLARQRGRMIAAGAALGVAVLVKLSPAVLALAWQRRGDRRLVAACATVVLAGYAPYAAGVGPRVLGFLPFYFGSGEDFNVGLRFFVTEAIGLTGEVARGSAMLLLFCVLGVVLLRIRRGLDETDGGIFHAGLATVSAYLVLVPTAMHPWYAVWVVPFLVVRWSPAWLWFTGVVSISYLTYVWKPADLPLWLRALEWLPLYGLLLAERWQWLPILRRAAWLPASALPPGDPGRSVLPPAGAGQAGR